MKKSIIFFAAFVILLCPVYTHASMPTWDEDTVFLYGMSVSDFAGFPLPPAPLDEEYLHAGLTIDVVNGMPFADRFLLVCLLNGHVQPYSINGQEYQYSSYYIEANGSIKLRAIFSNLFVADVDVQYLRIIVIGLLDLLPENAYDPVEGFTTEITIPFCASTEANTEVQAQTSLTPLSDDASETLQDCEGLLKFVDPNDQEGMSSPPFIQDIQEAYCELEIICAGREQFMQMIVFVDEAPCIDESLEIPCYQLKQGYSYDCGIMIDDLESGVHQFFAIACPVFEDSMLTISTNKICVNVLTE